MDDNHKNVGYNQLPTTGLNTINEEIKADNDESFIDNDQDIAYMQNELGVNKCYLAILCFFSTIGGILFGYNTSVIAGSNLYIEEDFEDVTDFQKELVVSLALLGAAVGALFSGPFSDRFGRKIAIYMADLLFIAG